MNNKSFELIKQELYQIIKEKGFVDSFTLNNCLSNTLLKNHLIEQLKSDKALQFYEYPNGRFLFCNQIDYLFYKPLKK